MERSEARASARDIHHLWEGLTAELARILDAHGVCAAAASEISVFTGVDTVVVLSGPADAYFDVWICDGEGRVQQKRWEGKQSSLRNLIDGGEAIVQRKYDRPIKDLVHSDLWLLAKESVLFLPLPYPPRPASSAPGGGLCLLDPGENCPLDITNIASLGMYLSTFLERAFLRQETDRQRVE